MITPLHTLDFTLQLADNALILGHRLSEWCSHGPVLEQDIAITNMALDHLGQARSLFQYAAEQINRGIPADGYFTSVALSAKNKPFTEDDLAFLRDTWDFRNVLLTEQPNGDWAFTILRSCFYDHYMVDLYTALEKSPDVTLAAIAEKSLKEALYHKRWSSEWVIRLGDGTEESHARISRALEALWPYTGELFQPTGAEQAMLQACGTDASELESGWLSKVREVLEEACLPLPAADTWMQSGGKTGTHSEHLGYLLAEMQYMQRTYPDMQW